MKTIFPTVILMFCFFQVSGQQIKSVTSGFSLQLHGTYANWSTSSFFLGDLRDLEPNGTGLGVQVSYGWREKITASIGYDFAGYHKENQWHQYRHQSIGLKVRVHFGGTLQAFRPFLEGELASHSFAIDPVFFDDGFFGQEYELRMPGIGGGFGGGTQWFILPNLALELSAQARLGAFSEVTLDGLEFDPDETLDFRFISLQLGVRYMLQ